MQMDLPDVALFTVWVQVAGMTIHANPAYTLKVNANQKKKDETGNLRLKEFSLTASLSAGAVGLEY